MKGLKKVLAFVIVFTMMLGLSVSASVFPDVDDNASYAEAVTILSALGIMYGDTNGNFRPDDTITRAEVATVVVRAIGLEDAAAGAKGATQFTDVAADHWATGYINLATQKGIIAGYGDGTFGPENPVTYEQVTKMIVAALGYTPKAENNGGYPTGYLVIASQEGIAKGAAGSNGEPAKRSTVARLVFNALEVDVMEQTGFKPGEPEYEVIEDKTLLEDYLNVTKSEGIITSTYLTDGSDVEDSFIVVGDDRFEEGKVDAASLIGMYVVAYSQEDEETGDETLVAVAPKTNRNKVVTLDYSEIDDATITEEEAGDAIKMTAVDVTYVVGSDDETLEINENGYKEFYNGRKASGNDVEEWLESPVPGNVTFISNDNNSDDFEVILVNAYTENAVVSAIDAAKGELEYLDDVNFDLDIEDEDRITYFFNADGSAAAFEDIEVGDTLTLINEDHLYIVYISKNAVEGSVDEERTNSKGEKVYTINGEEFKAANEDLEDEITAGDEGIFYLNIDNRIVACDTVATVSADKYAYLLTADADTTIDGAVVQVKFLAADGAWKTLNLAKKVSVYKDGDLVGGASTATIPATNGATSNLGIIEVTKTAGVASVSAINRTLFQYDVNSSGAIDTIYVTGSVKNDEKVFSLDYAKGEEGGAIYNANNDRVGSVYLDENTIVYSVAPAKEDVNGDGVTDEEIRLVSKGSMFQDGNEYFVDAYDNDDTAAVVVVYDAQTKIDVMSNILLVTKVTDTTNAEGDKIKKIYGLQGGEEVVGETVAKAEIVYEEAADGYSIAAGDVVIFSLDAAGAIEKIQPLLAYADAKEIIDEGTGAYYVAGDEDEYSANVFGFVADKKSGRAILTDGLGGDALIDMDGEETSISLSKANIYEIDTERKTPSYSVASSSDVIDVNELKAGRDANWLFVRMYDGIAIDAVIYTYEM